MKSKKKIVKKSERAADVGALIHEARNYAYNVAYADGFIAAINVLPSCSDKELKLFLKEGNRQRALEVKKLDRIIKCLEKLVK